MAAAREQRPMYVGIDVGGTNIATALVREDGKILARRRSRTPEAIEAYNRAPGRKAILIHVTC